LFQAERLIGVEACLLAKKAFVVTLLECDITGGGQNVFRYPRCRFSFGSLLDLFDAFLKFLLEDFLEELFSGDEQKVIKVVDGLSIGGIGSHLLSRESRRSTSKS